MRSPRSRRSIGRSRVCLSTGGHSDPRLQAPWHHHAVRRAGRQIGPGHRGMHATPPCQGVPGFLASHRPGVKKPRDIHLVLDNYATHKTPEVQAWLEKHPRFKLHFTPTSESWMDLEDAIYDYLLQHNAKPKPFVWSKTAQDILTRERRARPNQGKSVANV